MESQKHSLLVVDGSATYLFYMATVFRKLKYTVRTATTAELALKALNDSVPSLVITDILLSNMSGMEFLKKMKQNPQLRAIPVIIHTSDITKSLQEKCMAMGCVGYFNKPAEPDVLYRAIQKATEATPRRMIRIETSLKVEVGDGTVSGGGKREETVTSLSEGGLYVQSLTPEPVNTILTLTIFFASKQVTAQAEVHYSSVTIGGQHKQPGMGMQFVNISAEDKFFIRGFIKDQIAKGL
jgi:CheY-like chemotaxis protein